MTEAAEPLSYNEIETTLKKATIDISTAELHGLICGIICATSGRTNSKWQTLILGSRKSKKLTALLQHIFTVSYQQMSEFSFEFLLLLPDDSTEINTRTEALGLWCQGFLTGLGQGHKSLVEGAPPEVVEALDDITEIAQVNYGEMETDDENETAYFELMEYIRLAILMLFHEFKSIEQPITSDADRRLH